MSIRLAIEHRAVYRYDRPVRLGPQLVRLRHVVHPGRPSHARPPANAKEAEARRANRFTSSGHTPGTIDLDEPRRDGEYPRTLDLRRARRR